MELRSFLSKTLLLTGLVVSTLLASGCGDGEDGFVFTNFVPTGPTANNDTINGLGNATLNQTAANGVLANDAINGAVITAFDAATTQGGVVQMNGDGSFTYTPRFNFRGTDTFTYTLTNNLGASTATVTMNVINSGWFVNNNGSNGNGSQATPFNNLAAALAAATNGDTIFVFRGDGTANNQNGPFNLPAGVNLVGQGTGLILAQTIVPAGTAPVISGTITPAGGNTISGFIIDGSGGDAIRNTAGLVGLTVTNNTFRNSGDDHIELDDATGTVTITDNTFEVNGNNDEHIDIDNNNNSNCTYVVTGNTFTDATNSDPDEAIQFELNGTSNCTITFSNNTITGNAIGNTFGDGLELDCRGNSQATITANSNTFNTCDGDAIDIDTQSPNARITATVTGNMITNQENNCIEFDAAFGTINATITGNMINGAVNNGGIDVDADGNGSIMNALIADNQITNTSDDGIEVGAPNDDNGGNGVATAIIRNNVITNAGAFSVFCPALVAGNVCVSITGNTVEQDMRFDNTGTGTIQVERLDAAEGGPLTNLNTFNNAAGVQRNGTVNSVAAGTCVLP